MNDRVRIAVDAVWRAESPRLVAGLMRMVRDLDLAEELAQDALVAALERWPRDGVPGNPGAWLMATAKHRAIDRLRRGQLLARKHVELAHELDAAWEEMQSHDEALRDDRVGDDLLRLMFVACHPVLAEDARIALTLRLLGGLTTAEIARAFLVPEPTVAQRIVRAKRKLEGAGVPFELPPREALPERLDSVLGAIYLIFNEGYAASGGEDLTRPDLCAEALRLAGVLAELMPGHAEVHGLHALLALQASRLAARTDAQGDPVLLPDQDRARWNRELISRGLAALARAERGEGPAGPYALQAAIAACHARAGDTDWPRIVALYDALSERAGSPVVELNRAMAVAMAHGPQAGLDLADQLREVPALAGYHLLPGVRGELLARLGRHGEACEEFERAAALTRNARERRQLLERAGESARQAGR